MFAQAEHAGSPEGHAIMNQHSIMLRAANPNLYEGCLFARYLDRAAEGFFRFWLGRNAVDIVAKAYLHLNHDLSYQNVTFAERDNDIAGMVSGYTAEQHRGSTDQPLKQAAGRLHLRMMVVSILFAPLLRIIDTIADGDFYLQAIAVDKEHCGKGVGTALMDSIEGKAIASGSARIVLDVSAKNKNARRLYEHRGWTVESQWPKRMAIPGLRFIRMTKTLKNIERKLTDDV
jgi:ribosomal protein S18 acetylase RimI-like enzyme